ncbi:hypothetical protein GQ457_02G030750 [Hibiscus cannabinus]
MASCTNAMDKEVSYADNSSLQKNVLLKASSILEDSIRDMLMKIYPVTCIKVADLGCASGPNAFFPTCKVMETITRICQQEHWESPELQVFLNDLPQNDFNAVFRSVPAFDAWLKHCFVTGVAGSFYGRLFPSKSVHFIHSSFCLHWLSKVPEGVENNKGNVYIAKSSPPNVFKAYSEQFQNDFSNFLRSRSEEVIGGGKMLLTLIGRSISDPSKDCCYIWDLLAKSLHDLVVEGLMHESYIDSFNVPYYFPCEEEVRKIIENEGSFILDKIILFEENWDFEDNDYNKSFIFEKNKSGRNVANCLRAITEHIIVAHFGKNIVNDLFARYAHNVGEHLSREKTKYFCIVLVMTMK